MAMRLALPPDRRTLEVRMQEVVANLVRTAPHTPLVCDGCRTPQPAAAMTLCDGEFRCPRCATAASRVRVPDRTAAR